MFPLFTCELSQRNLSLNKHTSFLHPPSSGERHRAISGGERKGGGREVPKGWVEIFRGDFWTVFWGGCFWVLEGTRIYHDQHCIRTYYNFDSSMQKIPQPLIYPFHSMWLCVCVIECVCMCVCLVFFYFFTDFPRYNSKQFSYEVILYCVFSRFIRLKSLKIYLKVKRKLPLMKCQGWLFINVSRWYSLMLI